MVNVTKEGFDEDDFAKFQELLLDAEKPLYKGCSDFTKLSAIVKLLNLKGKYGASDKFFTELLGLLKKILPAGVDTYDASIKENFNLRAVVLWTINDYLVLGTLCGCHAVDSKLAPNPLTREQIYNEVQHIENKLGKGKRTNNKTLENQEDTRGRGRKIQKQKRKTTEEEGGSNLVNEAYWK
nr:putative transposon, En/Spm-like protein [Tanacetum cinerariifolium]